MLDGDDRMAIYTLSVKFIVFQLLPGVWVYACSWFLSTPVLMHGGLICIALRLFDQNFTKIQTR